MNQNTLSSHTPTAMLSLKLACKNVWCASLRPQLFTQLTGTPEINKNMIVNLINWHDYKHDCKSAILGKSQNSSCHNALQNQPLIMQLFLAFHNTLLEFLAHTSWQNRCNLVRCWAQTDWRFLIKYTNFVLQSGLGFGMTTLIPALCCL